MPVYAHGEGECRFIAPLWDARDGKGISLTLHQFLMEVSEARCGYYVCVNAFDRRSKCKIRTTPGLEYTRRGPSWAIGRER